MDLFLLRWVSSILTLRVRAEHGFSVWVAIDLACSVEINIDLVFVSG